MVELISSKRFKDREIVCYDRKRKREVIAYSDLLLPLGEGHEISLADYLEQEEQRVWELRRNARRISGRIDALNEIYRLHLVNPEKLLDVWNWRTRGVRRLPHEERIEILNTYYQVSKTDHGRLLDEIMVYLMAGSEGDHSAHELSLIRFALDFTMWSMRDTRRKTGVPAAFHSIESARGVAKNGRSAITIIGALYHDVLEEILDDYADTLVADVAENDPEIRAMVEVAGKMTEEIRLEIIRRNIDTYNDRATGIYYAIGLFLFYHLRMFPFPDRYYQFVNSLMEVLENLSRTKDTSYFTYIRRFVYPPDRTVDPIDRKALGEAVAHYFPNAEELLDEYLIHVEGFYKTAYGTSRSQEELQRNVFREILCKIVDRMNNTRDLDRHYFSISKRLYGAGFKNLYIVQAIEEKMNRNSRMPSEERCLINAKFLVKPKVAALYQMLDEIEHIRAKIGDKPIQEIEDFLAGDYMASPAFREVRAKGGGRPGSRPRKGRDAKHEHVEPPAVDGTVEFFTRVILGEKGLLKDVDADLVRAATMALVFRSLFEAFIAYPALIERERAEGRDGLAAAQAGAADSRFQPFRIKGLNPSLEERIEVSVSRCARELDLKTFRRQIIR